MSAAKKKKKKEDRVDGLMDEISTELTDKFVKNSSKPILKKTKRIRPKRNTIGALKTVKMSYKSWFINQVSLDKRLKPHHADSLRLYFKGLGLTDREESGKYIWALKVYFGDK